MRCLLNGNNARILAKAVQSLSKFGADLFVEADDDGLLLRALNATRSAVGSYKFKRIFFDTFTINPDVVNYCRITAKSCFNVFRNMRQVERCEIKICAEDLRLEIEIKCQHEQTKKVSISIIDEENITASVNIENTPHTITASCKIFNEISSSFNALEEEITLEAQPGTLSVKNYIEGAKVNDKFMRSQLKFSSNELDTYDVKEPTSITFCLKEFRAYLAFAEALNESVSLHFSEAGSPLFIRTKKLDILEGILIMSTLSPEDIEYYDAANQNSTINSMNKSTNQNKRKLRSTASNATNEPQTKRQNLNESELSNETVLFNFDGEMVADSNRETNNFQHINLIEENSTSNDVQMNAVGSKDVNDDVDVGALTTRSMSVEFYDTEEQNDHEMHEVINQSPKANIVRKIFSRCFQNTYFPDEPTSSSEVFAPDSDCDD